MACIGTPSNLELLLHHYYSPEPHPRRHAPAIRQGERFLMLELMIRSTSTEGVWEVTDKGITFIKHLLTVPFPEQVWVMPPYGQPSPETP